MRELITIFLLLMPVFVCGQEDRMIPEIVALIHVNLLKRCGDAKYL